MDENLDDQHEICTWNEYTRNNQRRFISEIRHKGLGTYRILKEMQHYILEGKVEAQFKKWDDQWIRNVNKNQMIADKEYSLVNANTRTLDAQIKQKEIENLLTLALSVDPAIDWDGLKEKNKFGISNPKNKLNIELQKLYANSYPKKYSEKPISSSFDPKFSVFDFIFKKLKQRKILQAEELYMKNLALWDTQVEEFNKELRKYEAQKKELIKKYDLLEEVWKKQESEFYKVQVENNKKMDEFTALYFNNDTNAVNKYCELVLNNSTYPESFPKDFDLDYNPDNKILIVEYVLPSPADLPSLAEVKYIAVKKELKESFLSETQLSKNYDSAIYKVSLRTLHELFEADKVEALDAITFNGWVNAINKATGKKVNNCIVTIQAKKIEFMEIDLSNVDPKTCFKNLKGIGSSKLSGITAVQPIAQISRNDKRFITSHEVANQLNQGFNLAAMDWQEFEHLIREIFEKEFSTNGGEVKVTQASRDGGVDAVAFDPDPIRGGKIVIQAKRYTNTVGVSAVRDLYGTVMNEGATKGILVSTADYGPDAYEFAKNKPLTLMNGGNLLYLLEKHGHKARIDLAEAKKFFGENLL